MVKSISGQKGFLLVEAMVAMLIITIAIFAIVGMFGQAAIANRNAGAYTQTSNIAQKYMEIYKQKIDSNMDTISPWNQVGSYDGNGKRTVSTSDFDPEDNANYNIAVEAQVYPANSGAFNASQFASDDNYKLVQLKVSVSAKNGNTAEVDLVTYCLRMTAF